MCLHSTYLSIYLVSTYEVGGYVGTTPGQGRRNTLDIELHITGVLGLETLPCVQPSIEVVRKFLSHRSNMSHLNSIYCHPSPSAFSLQSIGLNSDSTQSRQRGMVLP